MNTHNHIFVKVVFTLFISLLVFFFNEVISFNSDKSTSVDSPYLSNQSAFWFEIAGNDWRNPSSKVDDWLFNQEPPFKYRMLGKIPIYITYILFMNLGVDKLDSFYISYLFWSFAFLFLFLFIAGEYISKYIMLAESKLISNNLWSFYLGVISLASLPPVLFAFKFPVHGSPNDFLGYAIIALSLLSLINKDLPKFFIYTSIGIFCRETNLIVLVPFIFMNNWSLRNRFIISAGLFLILIGYRFSWAGEYDPFVASVHNFMYIYESIAFLFLVFSHFWFIGILQYINYAKSKIQQHEFVASINKSFIIASIAVLLVTFMFARVREIRIEYVLFFYYIPFGLIYIYKNIDKFISVLKSYYLFLIFIIPSIIVFKVMVELMPKDKYHYEYLISKLLHFYGMFGGGWVQQFLIYLFVSLFLIVLSYFYHLKKSFSQKTEK